MGFHLIPIFLYVKKIGRLYETHEETYTYTNINDNKVVMHVKVKLDPEVFPTRPKYEKYDFVYENLDGKKWVFTSFPYFR